MMTVGEQTGESGTSKAQDIINIYMTTDNVKQQLLRDLSCAGFNSKPTILQIITTVSTGIIEDHFNQKLASTNNTNLEPQNQNMR